MQFADCTVALDRGLSFHYYPYYVVALSFSNP